jgi:glycosyltransferase involved in cell wall biosynthesis
MIATPKIIIATIMRPTGETGVQTHFNTFKDYLEDNGVGVGIITPFSYYKWLVFPVFGLRKIIDRFSGQLSVWWYRQWHYVFLKQALIKELTKAATKKTQTVIYAQCPLSAKAAIEARQSEAQKVIMVVHFNGSQADEWAGKNKIKKDDWVYRQIKQLENQIIPLVKGIVYVSGFAKKVVNQNINETTKVKSIILPNFIQKPGKIEPSNTKGDLINIGTLEHRKNQSYLLQVLAEAKKQNKIYKLTLVGDGPDREKLIGLAQALGIYEQVNFIGHQKQIYSLLAAHCIYVHSALMESMGIVLIEAMAVGLPAIAAPVGGIPEVFSDGVEGLYWPLDNSLAAAQKLIELMEAPETRQRMGTAAKIRFEQNFETNVVAGKLLRFLCQEL